MATLDLPDLERRLKARGFKTSDAVLHDCRDCKEKALSAYVIAGRSGGREITLCQACGRARSWRSSAGMEERAEDTGFDLEAFLK